MSYRGLAGLMRVAGALGVLAIATVQANAGGLGLREQSSYGQGSSFAGVAAGGSLSSMFWNPATMTQAPGIQTELVATGILPYAAHTPTTGSVLAGAPFFYGGTGDTGDDALVPSGYASWQINPSLWLGLSLNSPFGLSVSFPDVWAGRDFAAGSTSLKTYNATPSIAYQINNWISVGAGMQIEYASATLGKGLGVVPTNQFILNGSGWGYGFTAGITLTPTPTTTIGLGYRSAINQKINGSMALPGGFPFIAPFSTPGSVSTTLNLPDVVSLGLRQRLSPQWTAMATAEWTNWSRIDTSTVVQPNGAVALVGLNPVTLPFQFSDGWFFSLGAEYQWNDQLAIRAGVGYEKSPITDQVRIPILPDNDRIWLSLGATYQVTRSLAFDFAYSHLFVKSTSIDITNTGNPWFIPGATAPYAGTVDSHVDIVSLALKYRWDEPAPKKLLYTK